MSPEFDAIVVGAGPAGSTCAYTLAKGGASVLLVERGKYPGAKNVWGGALYGPTLEQIFPDFKKEAPIERYVSRHAFSLLSGGNTFSFNFSSVEPEALAHRGMIVIRAKFDRWLAQKAEQAGAVLAAGLDVQDVIREDGKIAGVKAGGDNITANMVIACDGANSALARKVGLRGEFDPHEMKQGVKEVIGLPKEVIEQRFNVKGDDGVAWMFLGCTRGMPGGGFIYTNKDSLAVGIIVPVGGLMENKVNGNELLDDFKKNPLVASLIEGGKLLEYSAHLIPILNGNYPPVYTDGMILAGDAAGYLLNTGLILEGANYSMGMGVVAGKAALAAKEKNDFSAASLSVYQKMLAEDPLTAPLVKDLKTFSKAGHFLENPRIYTTYPEIVCSIAEKMFTNDGQPRKKMLTTINEARKGKISLWQLMKDANQARSAL